MDNGGSDGDARFKSLQIGVVFDNKDPEGAGRVRVKIPGLLDEPSGWAPAIGTGAGGSAQRGTFSVPAIGSDVAVLFQGGDQQRPFYMGGHFGKPTAGEEVPTDVKAAEVVDRPDIQSTETDQWIFTYDDRKAQPKLQIRHKTLALMIDIDAKKGILEITGEAGLSFKSNGFIKFDAPAIQFSDRILLKNGKPVS